MKLKNIKRKRKLFLLLLLIICIVGLFFLSLEKWLVTPGIHLKTSFNSASKNTVSNHPAVFFDEGLFYNGIKQAQQNTKTINHHIAGGIVPHHLYASFVIAGFFQVISLQKPKTIILLGPNHYEKGHAKIITSKMGWQTPFGVLEPDQQFIGELLQNDVKIDEQVVSKEYSVAGLMPFIKYYIPDSAVVPLLLSGSLTQEETKHIAQSLKRLIDKDTIIIASVDFSHNLSNQQAQEKDAITLDALKNFNYRMLFSFGNDYTDSPASLVTLLQTMELCGSTKSEILAHTNSGELQKNNSISTTSYFSIIYY